MKAPRSYRLKEDTRKALEQLVARLTIRLNRKPDFDEAIMFAVTAGLAKAGGE